MAALLGFLLSIAASSLPSALAAVHRVALFQRTLREIEKHNSNPNKNWVAGLNKFADYTASEFKVLLGHQSGMRGFVKEGIVSDASSTRSASFIQAGPVRRGLDNEVIDSLAQTVDWRNTLSSVQGAMDQGGCGSCWAAAAAGAINAALQNAALQKGTTLSKPVSVSFEEMVDCVPNPLACGGTGGCQGATAELAFEWLQKAGVVAQTGYKGYLKNGKSGKCDTTGRKVVAASGFVRLAENQYLPLKRAVAEEGPVVVSVDAGGWGNYQGGVFDGCPRDAKVNHAVLLVGYGRDEPLNLDYWLVRNSWGKGYGEKGYIRIHRHAAGIEDPEAGFCGTDTDPKAGVACKGPDGNYPTSMPVCGMCGILSDTSYPIGVKAADPTKEARQQRRVKDAFDAHKDRIRAGAAQKAEKNAQRWIV